MFNPEFKETREMLQVLANRHTTYIQKITLKWKELKDEDGNVYQIVPVVDIDFK